MITSMSVRRIRAAVRLGRRGRTAARISRRRAGRR
jgi:hypothetical protein